MCAMAPGKYKFRPMKTSFQKFIFSFQADKYKLLQLSDVFEYSMFSNTPLMLVASVIFKGIPGLLTMLQVQMVLKKKARFASMILLNRGHTSEKGNTQS